MVVSRPMPDCHVSYFWGFQMSTILRVFGLPTALKLGCLTNFDMLFLVMGFISLVDGRNSIYAN